ncbi:MAG: NUDIX hydrolase [Bacteroidota bacterium]|nr:NUDIX hydrolase [Bacteroidota bacterium]
MTEIKKWEILEEEDISPSEWFPLFRHKVKLANGHVMDDYFVSRLGDVAMIIPITAENEFVFVKQYKHGIREVTLEFPAGVIEKGQTPVSAAEAELLQETGIISDSLILLGELRQLPSKNFAKLFGYLATNVRITEPQDLDDSEEIEIVKLTAGEIELKIISGEINCADTVALYCIYKLKSGSAH